MSIYDYFFRARPQVSETPRIRPVELKADPYKLGGQEDYFLVASVEVGNTTTKCILTGTNLKDGRARLVNKTVKMTRDVRKPKPDERIFGTTLSGVSLTRESIAELVSDTLVQCHEEVNLDIRTDLDFAVRSTGVVAGFSSPHEVGEFIKALADGCLLAGIPPKKMVPAMSIDHLPGRLRKYSFLDKVMFYGAVGGVLPPTGSTGVEIVANEMEGELATAGIKEGAKWTSVDFRNPCFSMDFGTTLKGRITNSDTPFAKTIGNLCGYAGAIPDAMIKGTGLVDKKFGAALDLFGGKKVGITTWLSGGKKIEKYVQEAAGIITIDIVPENCDRFGSVPVSPRAARAAGVTLIGCDVGENGSRLADLTDLGAQVYSKHGLTMLFAVLDMLSADMVARLVKTALDYKLMDNRTAIGITGRAGITGCKPYLILMKIKKMGLYDKPEQHVVFVDDGLARGAAVMARCMNSLGTQNTPIGGIRGGRCVMPGRMALEKRKVEIGVQDV